MRKLVKAEVKALRFDDEKHDQWCFRLCGIAKAEVKALRFDNVVWVSQSATL